MGSALTCSLCAFYLGWWGQVDAGPGWVSDRSLKFASFRGLDAQGAWPSLDGSMHFQDEAGRYLDLLAREPALDSGRLQARGGSRGRWEVRAGWRELTSYSGFGTHSIYRQARPGQFVLANEPLATDLELRRRTLDLGASFKPGQRWRWEVDVQRSKKRGQRAFGAGVFTLNTSHLPVPVDYTTDRASLTGVFTGEATSLSAGLDGSWFRNGLRAMAWENPFPPFSGERRLRAALAPSNQALHARLGGHWRPSPRLRLSGAAVIGRAEQNEPFLPYTSNPAIDTAPLPRSRLDGAVDILDVDGRLSARLGRRGDITLRLGHDQRDNDTPIDAWTPVITDLAPRGETLNRPYSFERDEASLEGRYRPAGGWVLRAGISRRDMERSLQSVAETRRDRWWTEAEYRGIQALRFKLKLEAEDREGGAYETFVDPGLPENPLMRKFHLADRNRQGARLEVSVAPLDFLDLSLSLYLSDDDYPASAIGLQASRDSGWDLDASWSHGNGMSAWGFISGQRIETVMAGATDFMLPWRAQARDEFLTLGLGFGAAVSARMDLRVNFLSSDARGAILTAASATPADVPFPPLTTELRKLHLELDFRSGGPWIWRLALEHEHFDSRDWQVDGLGIDGIAQVLTLGPESPDYDVSVLRILAHYGF